MTRAMTTPQKRLASALAVFALAFAPNAHAAEPPLKDWAGKYPSDELVPHQGDLLHQPRLRDSLRKLLPPGPRRHC